MYDMKVYFLNFFYDLNYVNAGIGFVFFKKKWYLPHRLINTLYWWGYGLSHRYK